MHELLKNLVEELVDHPSGVIITETQSDGGNTIVLTVRTGDGDMGKVIGKQGKNAQAIRTLFEAIAAKQRRRVVLEIADRKTRPASPIVEMR